MGQSPKESASADMQGRMKSLQDRYLGGDLSGENQFKKVDPYFEQGKDYLNESLSTRMMGIGQNVGESLISSGVPKGAPQANLFAGAMAPAIAQNQTELAGLAKTQGGTLADLLKFAMGQSTNAGQLEQGAIGTMKDSTTMGDIMSGLTSAFSLADIISNPKILQMLFGGSGASGSFGMAGNPGGISSGSNAAINNKLPF
jgi:hypothetical protein